MLEWLLGFPLRPGYQVAWVLATLFCVVWVIGLRQIRRQRRQAEHSRAERQALSRDGVEPTDEASLEALRNTLGSLEKYDRLQGSLRERLQTTRQQTASARVRMESQAGLLRQSAVEMRLPHTVHEIFESLRLLPRKSAQAQQADREWHRLVGIEPGPVLVLDAASSHCVVDFECFGRAMRITGRTFKLSRAVFDELSLFDDQEQPVLTARVVPDPQRLNIVEATVSSHRPGPWVDLLVESRLLMDERRETLLLHSQYRDLEKMRDDFGLDANLFTRRLGL
ncbi:MAG: hypothetical protein QUV35_07115 [Hydrogenophaga sp.]|uniref:hypothetical protein n=1 Tax=Hydrogenophaga sp. TaxID=1904254 RepID=UPI002621AE1C|nr:hypothetical protein [Hydrogenophaga sp.]MDM7942382.1 hypothetical protein [Hydrogenophaga sp.]